MDAGEGVSRLTYNALGYPEKIISPLGGVRTICYNDFNLPISSQDENNIVTTYRYNTAGLIDQVSQTHEGTTLSYPLGYPDGWNALAYCNNGVTDAVDLWGCRKTHEEHGAGQCEVSWQNAQDPVIKYGLIYYGTCNGSSISCKTMEIDGCAGSRVNGKVCQEVIDSLGDLALASSMVEYSNFAITEVPNTRKEGHISLSFEVLITCVATVKYYKRDDINKDQVVCVNPFKIVLDQKEVSFKCEE